MVISAGAPAMEGLRSKPQNYGNEKESDGISV
jgi:hypothetical protein